MDGYIDIHSHVLFGVDDGAKNLEMSLEMIEMAYAEGIRLQYATPHFSLGHHSASREQIEEHFNILQKEVKKQFPDYQLYLGSELYYENGMLEALKNGKALTMNGSRYVLVEFAFAGEYDFMYNSMRELTRARYKPILAHMERYQCLRKKADRMSELKNLGVFFQLNSENFMGSSFSPPYRNAMKLIGKGWIDYIATDAHNKETRAPKIKKAMEAVAHKYGNERIKKEFDPDGNNTK